MKRMSVTRRRGRIDLHRGWTSGCIAAALCLVVSTQAWAETRLKMVAWNFQVETVKEFISAFEAENPDLKVEMEVVPSAQFASKIQLMRSASTPFDVLYAFDHILSQWSAWLEPLDGYEGAGQLKEQMLPLALQSMTFNGKLYGLPYYTSYFGLLTNTRLMKEAGFASPPASYDEWMQQAKTIKEKGLSRYPMLWPVKHTGWGGMWVLNTMVASRGGKLLDEALNVTPEGLKSLQWWAETYKAGLSDPNGIELDPNDSARAFMAGESYTIMTANFFAGPQWANDKEKSKVAGAVVLAPTPDRHKTVGFARMYAINGSSTHKPEAWRLLKFLGATNKSGAYVTPQQWVEKGTLTWGYRGLERDPIVSASLKSWGAEPDGVASSLLAAVHMREVVPFQALWYAEWELYANGVLQNVLAGKASPEDGARMWSERAKALAARYK